MAKKEVVSLDEAVTAYDHYRALNPRGRDLEFEGIRDRITALEGSSEVEEIQEQRRLLLQTRVYRMLFEALVQQLDGNQTWAQHRAENDRDFTAAPRTFMKTAQDILTEPEDRMVTSREQDVDLESMVVSPRRVTPALLKNLGLDQYLPPRGSRGVKRMEAYVAAIPAIKEMFGSLEPVRYPGQEESADLPDLRYFRLMRMGAGANEGLILGTQNIRKTADNEQGDKILFKTDLYGAERRVLHINARYREELAKLASIDELLRGVYEALDRWTADEVRANEDKLMHLRQDLLKIAESLDPQLIRNHHKRAIRTEVGKCLTLRDSRDRYNPNVIQGRISYARREVGARLSDIQEISECLGGDQVRMTSLAMAQEAPLTDFCNLVAEMHERFRVFRESPLDGQERSRVLANLERAKSKAERLEYEPYLSLGKAFIRRIDLVKAKLEQSAEPTEGALVFHVEAQAEFVKAYLISKVAKAYRDLQAVYRRFSLNPEDVDPRVIIDEVQKIQDELGDRQVARDVKTPLFDKVWGEIYHLCNGIKKDLRPLIEGDHVADAQQGTTPDTPVRSDQSPSRLETILGKMGSLGAWVRRRLENRGILRRPDREETTMPGSPKSAVPPVAASTPSAEDRKRIFDGIKERFKNISFKDLAAQMSL